MTLEKAFQAYADLVEAVIAASKQNAAPAETIRQPTYDVLNLKSLVDDLESQREFQTLVNETALNFSKEPYNAKSFEYLMWKYNVESFFRRSGFYLSAYNGETLNISDELSRYVDAFKQERVLRKYLVPLEFIDFGDKQIDFGSFRIVQFSRNELESLLQSNINQVFYPYAYADLSELARLWLLEVIETVDAWEPGSGGPAGLRGPEVGVTFTDFPPNVEYALKLLALYDWGTYQAAFPVRAKHKLIKEHDTGWDSFHVPFVVTVNENQLWSPDGLPNLSVIATQPDIGADGEDLGEKPVVSISLETDEFRRAMQSVATLMAAIEEKRATEWAFVDVALGYLVKAFFASGLDQLLWHIVVIESLLGDKGDSERSLTARIKRRTAYVGAQNKKEISEMRTLVDTLYTLRSNMVHGNTELINSEVYLGHLRAARDLARKVSLWFLESLCNLHKQATEQGAAGKVPTRKEILAALDVLLDDEMDTGSVTFALNVVHKTF